MTLQEQVNKDIIEAMKAKQQERLDSLRMLKAQYIQNNTSPKPTDDLTVTISHAKKLLDALPLYTAGTEAHDKILREYDFIKVYLPEQLEESAVVAMINDIKAAGAKDMGAIMKDLQPQIKGKFDGKRASELVKAALA